MNSRKKHKAVRWTLKYKFTTGLPKTSPHLCQEWKVNHRILSSQISKWKHVAEDRVLNLPPFVLKANVWISTVAEPGAPVMWWQQFVFLPNFFVLLCLVVTRFVRVPPPLWEHVSTPSPPSPSPVTPSAECWQPPCCFVYFASPCVCSICICMSTHTHTYTQIHCNAIFPPQHRRWHIPLWVLWLPIGKLRHALRSERSKSILFVNAEGEFATAASQMLRVRIVGGLENKKAV